jgi:LysM repeat protein
MEKRTLFLVISGVFVMVMVYFSMDLFTKTTPPWKKEKKNKVIDIEDTTARYFFADTTIYVYTVKRNEGMEGVAQKFNMHSQSIKTLNELATETLKENQKVMVYLRATHEVAPNEFLEKIARNYQVEMKAIMRANGIGKAEKIRAGQKLLIPVGVKK